MVFWLFIILLGITLYFIVQRSVVKVTTAPWWQLWLALMVPAFTIVGWTLLRRSLDAMPTLLLVGSFGVSMMLYLYLLTQHPRREREAEVQSGEANLTEERPSATEPTPPQPLSQGEQALLQNCFPWSVYYLQNIDLKPQAVVCRGQLRSAPEVAYQTIQQKIQTEFGDRFLVLFQSGGANQPFFVLVNNPYAKAQRLLHRPLLALGLLGATLVTTTLMGAELNHPTLNVETILETPHHWLSGLPYAIALLCIMGLRELSTYFTAQFYHIQTTLPYFIPIPFAFGTLGTFLQRRSPIPNRTVLFDLGCSGAVVGLGAALPFFLWGLFHSDLAPLPEKANILTSEALNPRVSIAFGLLCRLIYGQALTASVGVDLHPVAIAGGFGLLFTAIKLFPFGSFDGGQIVHGMYGQRTGLIVSQVCRILVLLLSFVQPILLYLGLFLMVIPAGNEPALNDVSDLDNYRDVLGLFVLGLLLLIILPVPAALEPLLFTPNPVP